MVAGKSALIRLNALREKALRVLLPPPTKTISEWADEYRFLSEGNAEPGRWKTSRTPYLREPMDCLANPDTHELVFCGASQCGKTELIMNCIGKHIHYDPCRILHILPSEDDFDKFSKERVAPFIEDTPVIKSRIKDDKYRAAGSSTLLKRFSGGYWAMVGANVPSKLSSRPVRLVIADECDRYGMSAGVEGSPIELAEKRQTTFWNYIRVKVSSPSIEGMSYIWDELERSSYGEWHIPCPACGELQVLKWGQLEYKTGVPLYVCSVCGVRNTEVEWKRGAGRWIHRNEHNYYKRGFHISALVSPWISWAQLAKEWQEIHEKPHGDLRHNALKVFINTRLAECWSDIVSVHDPDMLARRREYYNAELPERAVFLCAGVDVQDDRIELEVVAYGHGRESWGVEYKVFVGDPRDLLSAGSDLDVFLTERKWETTDGRRLGLNAAAIDSGGHFTGEVYTYALSREAFNFYAIKGQGGGGREIFIRGKRTPKIKNYLITLGVDTIKAALMKDIQISSPGPGYCHWPLDENGMSRGYQSTYFQGLMSERPVVVHTAKGKQIVWKKKAGARNEPLDCRVYAAGILACINPPLNIHSECESEPTKSKKGIKILRKGIDL